MKRIFDYPIIIFDLDNTLYPENEYLYSGYKAIGEYVHSKIDIASIDIENYLIETFQKDGRYQLFNKLLSDFGINDCFNLDELLNIVRSNKVLLSLYDFAYCGLIELTKSNKRIYVLTNGNVIQQKNKVDLLKLEYLFPNIKVIYANDYESKPSPCCIQMIMKETLTNNDDLIFIGDSLVDEETARNSNIAFMNVQEFKCYELR